MLYLVEEKPNLLISMIFLIQPQTKLKIISKCLHPKKVRQLALKPSDIDINKKYRI